jgi:hypothetical protein
MKPTDEIAMKPCLAVRPSTPSAIEVPMNRCSEIRPSVSSPSFPVEAPMKTSKRRTFTPQSLFHGLAHELRLLAPVYARLHAAHPDLSPYPTLPDLLERVTTGPHDDAKKELVASLIAIRQTTPHRLWVAIVLWAFRPMLARLWTDLFGSDRQERLALLILAFQEALCQIDPTHDPVRVAMYVRQATRRRVIDALKAEIEWRQVGFGEDADRLAVAESPSPDDHRRAVERLLRPGALSAHVRRSHPTLSPKEQARVYHKLRRGLLVLAKAVSNDNDAVTGAEVMP